MDLLFYLFVFVYFGFVNVVCLMCYVGLLVGVVFCFVLFVYVEVIFDSVGLDLLDVKVINNQLIFKLIYGVIYNECVKLSFDYCDNDGMQVEEYCFQKGQVLDIYVKLGMGIFYNMSKFEDSLLCICECGNIDCVFLVNVLKF